MKLTKIIVSLTLTFTQVIVSMDLIKDALEKKEYILQKPIHKVHIIIEDDETIQITKGNEKLCYLNEEKKKMKASVLSAEKLLGLLEDSPRPKSTHLSKSQIGLKMSCLSGSLLYGYRRD